MKVEVKNGSTGKLTIGNIFSPNIPHEQSLVVFTALNNAPSIGKIRAEIPKEMASVERYWIATVRKIPNLEFVVKKSVIGPWKPTCGAIS